MRNPDLSGKSGCEMRRNPVQGYPNLSGCEIRIGPENPDVKCEEIRAIATKISEFVRMRNLDLSGKTPDFFVYTGCDCADFSKKSGCEMRRNPGNHHGDLRKNPDAEWVKIRICLLAVAC